MDSKTRFLMAMNHEKPDRPPFNFWMDRRLMAEYEKKIGHRNWRVTHYGADVIEVFPYLVFPAGKFVEHEGSQWLSEPYPLNWDDINSLPMPDPYSDEIFKLMMPDLEEHPDVANIMIMCTPWSVIANMVGYERIYLDMMDYPEQFKALARKVTDIMKIAVERACDKGITALYIQEDVASAKGMLMSHQATWEFCFDYAKEIIEVAKAKELPVLFHCCGKVMELLDDFVKVGTDAINPIQPHLNDLKSFKASHGDKLTVYGGLDNCFIISQGTTDQVREHIFDVFETVGKPDGGLIFSTHDIDINVPRENVEVMVEAIKECRY